MRRFLILFLTVIMVTALSVNIWAGSKKDFQYAPENLILTDPNTPVLENARPNGTLPSGVKPLGDGDPLFYNVEFNVIPFGQSNSPWGSDIMQTGGDTIGWAGCALCSSASVFNYHAAGLWSTNPRTLNNAIGPNADPLNWTNAASLGSYNCNFNGLYTFSYSNLSFGFDLGTPPILRLAKGTSQHWVTVYKALGYFADDSTYSIADSASGGLLRPLTDYTSNGWTMTHVALYVKR